MKHLKPLSLFVVLLLILNLSACGGNKPQPNPPKNVSVGLSIINPAEKQVISGTVALAASGIGGSLSDLSFTLNGTTISADASGQASINTRTITDGVYTLEASAKVAGKAVSESFEVTVKNDLPSSGTVDEAGGALKTDKGSYAMIPPNAVSGNVKVSVEDLSEQKILDDFAIDYGGMGITFLGAVIVSGDGAKGTDIPMQVDLAGWTKGVQDNHQVLMFALASDADGDGVGELMFAADAVATDNDSVITVPVPTAEVTGLGSISGSALRAQQDDSVKPGEIITVAARGFLPGGALSNTASFGTNKEILTRPTINENSFYDPLMNVQVAVPALGTGQKQVSFRNVSSGYESEPLSISVASLGTGSVQTWQDFVAQARLALENLSNGKPQIMQLANPWLAALENASNATAAAMAQNSTLVSTSNKNSLAQISGASYSNAQRELVFKHALVLDAIAISVSELAQPAADLAALLVVTTPMAVEGSSLSTLQSGGSGGCSGPGFQNFGPTGMGSAPPPGGSNCGGGAGGGSGGSLLSPQRLGSFGPVEGAIVRILRRDGSEKLTPFTAITDEAGYYYIPFVANGEPYTVLAVDPKTQYVAKADGVGVPYGQSVSTPLVFLPPDTEGAPIANFTVTKVSDGAYEFDPSSSTDADGNIIDYTWVFEDGGRTPITTTTPDKITRYYLSNQTFTVELTVLDNDGKSHTTSQEVSIEDSPNLSFTTTFLTGEPAYSYLIDVSDIRAYFPEEGYFNWDVEDYGLDTGIDAIFDSCHAETTDYTDCAQYKVPGTYRVVIEIYWEDVEGQESEFILSQDLDVEPIELSISATHLPEEDPATYEFAVNLPFGSTSSNYIWDFGDGKIVDLPFEDEDFEDNRVIIGPKVQHEYRYAGTYTINLTIDEDVDEMYTAQTTITIDPVLNIDVVASSRRGFREGTDISSDGNLITFIAMEDLSTEITESDMYEIYVQNLSTGERTLVNTTTDGNKAVFSQTPVMSDDGRYIAFASGEDNLIEGQTDADGFATDVFVKDMQTGELIWSSTDLSSSPGNRYWQPALTGDGKFLVYSDTGQIYRVDLETKDIVRVSENKDGIAAVKADTTSPVNSSYPVLSQSGRFVAFESNATNLVLDDVADGFLDIFVKDLDTGEVIKASTATSGTSADNSAIRPSLTADGLHVLFVSKATNLIPEANDFRYDYYLKDTQTGALSLVNTLADGTRLECCAFGTNEPPIAMTRDGRYILFNGRVLEANYPFNNNIDIIKDMQTGEVAAVGLTDVAQRNNGFSYSFSADGRYLSLAGEQKTKETENFGSNIYRIENPLWTP